MINLDHVPSFNIKQSFILSESCKYCQMFVPFCKHALRVFHAIAWLVLLAHAQTNFPPVIYYSSKPYVPATEARRTQCDFGLPILIRTRSNCLSANLFRVFLCLSVTSTNYNSDCDNMV